MAFFNYIKNSLKSITLYDLIFIIFIKLLSNSIYSIYKIFFRKRFNLNERYGENSWCLVTGATDGIGKAFCFEFAKENFNIILVSRTLTKLNKVSEEIKSKYPKIKTQCVEFDFFKKNSTEEYLKTFGDLQNKYDISLLVNNIGTDHFDDFEKLSLNDISQEVILNICPQAYMTKIFWNKIKERNFNDNKDNKDNNNKPFLIPNGKRSGILNVSSFAGDFPFPMKAVYAATKAFDHFFSIGLENEVKGSNVDFLSVKPLEVATPLTGTEPDGIFIITPEQCVISVVNDIGYESETYGHWAHKLQAWIVNLLPRGLVYWFLRNYSHLIIHNPNADKGNLHLKNE
jgi:17beta-estradiol 17-dehydrogenase / very-long-chain 3-oxoacyl-CoA reductase